MLRCMTYRSFLSCALGVCLLSSTAFADEPPPRLEGAAPRAPSTYVAPEVCENEEAFRARLGADPPPYDVRIVQDGDRYEGTLTVPTKGGASAARSFASGTCDDVTRGLALAIGLVALPPESRSAAREPSQGPLALPPTPGLPRPSSVDDYRAAFRALELRRKAATNPGARDAILQEERQLKAAYHEDTTLRSKPTRIAGFVLGGLGLGAIAVGGGALFTGRIFKVCDNPGEFLSFCTKQETRDDHDRIAAIAITAGLGAAFAAVPLIVWGNGRVMREAPVVKASFGPGSFVLSGTF